jgi:hypothetical protein
MIMMDGWILALLHQFSRVRSPWQHSRYRDVQARMAVTEAEMRLAVEMLPLLLILEPTIHAGRAVLPSGIVVALMQRKMAVPHCSNQPNLEYVFALVQGVHLRTRTVFATVDFDCDWYD